jgi:hypothetical protein
MIVLGLATVVAAALIAARVWMNPAAGPAPSMAPVTTSEPVPMTSPSVQAVPQEFPDLEGFSDVSRDHEVSGLYPLATFTSPTGLQCAMLSNRGGTAASCYGAIPGLDQPANQVYADDYGARFDQGAPPDDAAKLNGKPLASGEKVVLGAGGTLMGGDHITCGAQDELVACVVVRGFDENHGDDTAQRHGFVLSPQRSWTF